MKKPFFGVVCIWLAVLCLSFFWNFHSLLSNQEKLILQTAKTLFDQMIITRRWNSLHNGVYVKVTDQTQPNPYLKDPERDLQCQGFSLTKINPALMTREISEMTDKKLGALFHVSGLNPLNPHNKPDEWEKKALEEFSKKISIEKSEFILDGRNHYFIFMKGLTSEASCLVCHTEKEYTPDGIIGGISIKIFNPPKPDFFPILTGHLIIGGLGFIIILFSGTKLIKAYETIQHQAVFDALTHLPNRRYFNERMVMELKRAKRLKAPISVIMADIDHFKAYNDFYGHDKGDEVLVRVAGAIKETLQRPVDFCARYGGEEFIVVLPDTDERGAVHVVQQILEQVRALNIRHERSMVAEFVTISLGIFSDANSDHETLIKNADTALYKAKANGKNRFEVFRSPLDKPVIGF